MNPRGRAVVAMALANAFHFGAYELARSAIMALFTSETVAGFASGTAVVTLATGLVSPVSVVLLYAHRSVFDRHGPRRALWYRSVAYTLSISMTSFLLQWCWSTTGNPEASLPVSATESWITWSVDRRRLISQGAIVFLFVVKNAFVQLLSAQHWSFITSVLSQMNSATSSSTFDASGRWSSIIAGVASVVATMAGWMVSPLIGLLGQSRTEATTTANVAPLTGVLLVAAAVMMVTTYCSDVAYRIALKHSFAPTGTVKADLDTSSNGSKVRLATHSSDGDHSSDTASTLSLWKRAALLFQRLPVLQALCAETLICQSISSLLSYLFVSFTKHSIPLDDERAQYTGLVYARINLGSGILQFGVIPLLFGRRTAQGDSTRALWLVMPLVGLASAAYTMVYTHATSGMNVLTLSFIVTKILEYSLRSSLTERLYGSLDDEGRFLGKETIGLLANRFGKSTTAVGLAVLTATYPSFLAKQGPVVLAFSNALWLVVSLHLVQLLALPKHKAD